MRFHFRCMFATQRVFGFLYASPCCAMTFYPCRTMWMCVCVQRSHIKYKLVRKYYDNAATVVVAARCCCCCSVLFIRCVLRSGKYYIHFNFRFPSFFSLSRSRRFFIVTFLPITHFIYSYSCNRSVSEIRLNQRVTPRHIHHCLSKLKKPNGNLQQSLHFFLFHIFFLSHVAIGFGFINLIHFIQCIKFERKQISFIQ